MSGSHQGIMVHLAKTHIRSVFITQVQQQQQQQEAQNHQNKSNSPEPTVWIVDDGGYNAEMIYSLIYNA